MIKFSMTETETMNRSLAEKIPPVCQCNYLESVGKFVPFIWLRDCQLFSHIIHPHLALVVPSSNMEPTLGPGDSVESRPALHRHAGTGHLGVLVEVPQVQPPGAVHCSEESRVLWRPSTVVHIVTCSNRVSQSVSTRTGPHYSPLSSKL